MKDRCVGMRKSAAISVLTALISLSSSAVMWDWYGLGAGQTSYFDDPACWSKNSGLTPVVDEGSYYLTGTKPQYTDKWDKTITFRNNANLNGHLNVEYAFRPIVFRAEKPEDGITGASAKNLTIYNDAELQINSGTYFFHNISMPGCSTETGGTLTLNGGILNAKNVFGGNKGVGRTVRVVVNGGTLTVNGYLSLGESSSSPGELIINGGIVKNTAQYLTVGGNSPSVCTVRKGGLYSCNNSAYSMIVGSAASGTLNIEGGEVLLGGPLFVSYIKNGTASINVTDGGVLRMSKLEYGNQLGKEKGGNATLYLNGGTIRAAKDENSFIYGSSSVLILVGPEGGIVDTAGHTIRIRETFIENSRKMATDVTVKEKGHMAFVGGGVVEVLDPIYYSGSTTIEAGTRLDFISAKDITNSLDRIFANGLVVTMPKSGGPASGTEVLKMVDNCTIPEKHTVGSNFVVAGAPAESPNWHLEISEDRKAIVLVEDSLEEGSVLTFTEDATHAEPVTASVIAVADGKTASVTSSTSGALRKVGSGTLELTASRTDETVLTDGTLRFSSGATVDPAKLKLGGDPRVPVTFDYGGQTLNADLGALCGVNSDVTLVNGTFGMAGGTLTLPNATLRFSESAAFMGNAISLANQSKGCAEICKASGDWSLTGTLSIGSKDGSTAVFRHNGGTLTAKYIFVGNYEKASSALLEVNGGTVEANGYFTIGEHKYVAQSRLVINGGLVRNVSSYVTVGGSSSGEMTVRKGGRYVSSRDGMLIVASSSHGTLNIEGGEVSVSGACRLCDNAYNPNNPATVNITDGGILSFAQLYYGANGSTGSPAKFNIDGGVIRANKDNVNFIPALEHVTFNIGTRGAVFDNAGYDVTIAEDLLGFGTVTFSGSGTTTLGVSQTGSGAISVSDGSTLAFLAQDTELARRVILPSGATLAMPESGTVSLTSGMTLFEGAVLRYAFDANGTSKLSFDKALNVEGNSVTVAITGSKRPQDGFYKLTAKGGFAGKTVELAPGAPRWVRRVTVADDGNLEAYIAPLGFNVVIR